MYAACSCLVVTSRLSGIAVWFSYQQIICNSWYMSDIAISRLTEENLTHNWCRLLTVLADGLKPADRVEIAPDKSAYHTFLLTTSRSCCLSIPTKMCSASIGTGCQKSYSVGILPGDSNSSVCLTLPQWFDAGVHNDN